MTESSMSNTPTRTERIRALITADLARDDGPSITLGHSAALDLYGRLADAGAKAGPNSREVDIRDRRLQVLARLLDVVNSSALTPALAPFVASTKADYPDVFEDLRTFERMHRPMSPDERVLPDGPYLAPLDVACPFCCATAGLRCVETDSGGRMAPCPPHGVRYLTQLRPS